METINYKEIARQSRLKVLDMINAAQTSHIGSNFSCADIMAVLFEKIDLDRDRFVLSAGWKAATLYYHLWRKGRITQEQLDSYCQPGSEFIGLAEPVIPEIVIAGGSMGLGLPGAVGLALAKKIKGEPGTVYVLMSDGELQCGTTWESALIAAQQELDNLVVIVDNNGFQAMGKTEDIAGGDLASNDLWECIGWDLCFAKGHEYKSLEYNIAPSSFRRPKIISATTTKGKGVSFMENQNIFHYKAPNQDEYERAKEELNV